MTRAPVPVDYVLIMSYVCYAYVVYRSTRATREWRVDWISSEKGHIRV